MAMHEYISEFPLWWNMLMALNQQIQEAKFWHQTSLMEFKIHTLKTNSECKTLKICLHYIEVLLKKIRDKRSENLILAIALHKPQHNVTSMQLKAVYVTNVAVMIISSRTALLIEIMTRKTVVLPMVNRNITMITDQIKWWEFCWEINSGCYRLTEKFIETKQAITYYISQIHT